MFSIHKLCGSQHTIAVTVQNHTSTCNRKSSSKTYLIAHLIVAAALLIVSVVRTVEVLALILDLIRIDAHRATTSVIATNHAASVHTAAHVVVHVVAHVVAHVVQVADNVAEADHVRNALVQVLRFDHLLVQMLCLHECEDRIWLFGYLYGLGVGVKPGSIVFQKRLGI